MNKPPKIEINRATNKEFFLTVKAANGRKILTSGETYKRRDGALNAVKVMLKDFHIKGALIVDNTQPPAKK